jgi:nucleoside-diphosphate kinase
MDRTLILVKPDAFARNLTGEIIARFERKGLRIAALRHMTLDRQTAEQHYAEHEGKPFFEELVAFITSGPLVAPGARGQDAGQGGAPGDRRRQPARGRAGLDPRRLRRRGRPEHGPRLRLAESAEREAELFFPELTARAACHQRVRILAGGSRLRLHGRAGRRAELAAGKPRAVAAENARRKAARDPGELVWRRHVERSTARSWESRARGAGARSTSAGSPAARTPVVGGIALARGGAIVAQAVEETAVTFRAARRGRGRGLTWRWASGRAARGLRDQGAGAALVRATTGTP